MTSTDTAVRKAESGESVQTSATRQSAPVARMSRIPISHCSTVPTAGMENQAAWRWRSEMRRGAAASSVIGSWKGPGEEGGPAANMTTTGTDRNWLGYGMPWSFSLVRCADGSLYTGVATDVPRRAAAHNAGRGARYTRSRRPVRVVHQEPAAHRSAIGSADV